MKTKKIIAASLILFCVTNCFSTYDRKTENGGPSGYDTTSKVVNGDNTTIRCKDPGYSACPERPANPGHGPLVDYAIAKIQAGHLSGYYGTSSGTVVWTSDDINMTNSSIIIN